MTPTCYLEPTRVNGGGTALLSQDLMQDADVISGTGPKPYLDHIDRPRRKLETSTHE